MPDQTVVRSGSAIPIFSASFRCQKLWSQIGLTFRMGPASTTYGIGSSICMCCTRRHRITPDRRLEKGDRLADRRYRLAIHLRERGRERKFEARQRGVRQDISFVEGLR